MLNEKELPFLAEKGHSVSLVGGGGKTTLLYAMADHCARKGWQVLVTTTTHIRQPAACYAPDDAALTALWQAGHYAVIGTPAENGKLTLPQPQLLRRMAQADAPLTPPVLAQLLASAQGGRKAVGDRQFYAVLNQADTSELRQQGIQIQQLLRQQGIPCVLTHFKEEERA